MGLFGGEKARKNETEQSYVDKYPLTNSIDDLQKNLNLANIELVGLKNSKPSNAGAKRIRQRNITALSNRIVQLSNKIKDLKSGVSNQFGGLAIAPPVMAQLPKIPTVTAEKLLGINEINRVVGRMTPEDFQKEQNKGVKLPIKETDVTDLARANEATPGTPVDAAPMGAQGDYPPPAGAQDNNIKKVVLYTGIALAIAVSVYYLYKKKN
jgi:UDP-N-acetylglucosamine:LPS N-acetylglucosamine transferase